ncbi:hypothetical protein [Novacetimonas pomaceti]|uniref:hypothetical protein n=1 Tax=Novacetimonas pomaceti TaxID=2021998 RepID=UPI0014032947|nr:hypothetical protein [Novacetimonas pomaceti]
MGADVADWPGRNGDGSRLSRPQGWIAVMSVSGRGYRDGQGGGRAVGRHPPS